MPEGAPSKDSASVCSLGPHPQRYHDLVFAELDTATVHCRSVTACRAALQSALRRLAREVTTRGTELNLLPTRGATPWIPSYVSALLRIARRGPGPRTRAPGYAR
nr:AHH domain-containing protein [Myxococcus sp. AM010]